MRNGFKRKKTVYIFINEWCGILAKSAENGINGQ